MPTSPMRFRRRSVVDAQPLARKAGPTPHTAPGHAANQGTAARSISLGTAVQLCAGSSLSVKPRTRDRGLSDSNYTRYCGWNQTVRGQVDCRPNS